MRPLGPPEKPELTRGSGSPEKLNDFGCDPANDGIALKLCGLRSLDRSGGHPQVRAVATDYEIIGDERLQTIIDEFVDRIFDDVMIGFFFRNADKKRIKQFEFQHAAAHLGAETAYQGRPLDVAHRAHRIMGGHFERRKKLLSDVLVRHQVPDDVRARWLAQVESLRSLITSDPGSECR